VNIVLADAFAPGETRCFTNPSETVKVGWRFSDGKVMWWGRCSPATWDAMHAQIKEDGYDRPVEDCRTKDDGKVPPFYRPPHLL
jgi:hypothetical protein